MGKEQDFSTLETCILYTCHLVGWVWNAFTILPWYFLSGNYKVRRYGETQAISVSGLPEGPYRGLSSVDELSDNYKGVETLDQLFKNAADLHEEKNCLGTRELIAEEDEVQPNGRVFKKVILGDYKWISCREAYNCAQRISSGLKALGVETKEEVVIFAETKAEWFLTAQACYMRNFPVVTIYATLGDEALVYGFTEVQCRYVVTDAALLPKMKSLLSKLPAITTIIYFGDAKKVVLESFPESLKLYSLAQVVELGSKLKYLNAPIESPESEDVAVIMYTSGSTGVPKGVLLTHHNVVSTMKSCIDAIPELSEDDTYIGYLPLAHILELICESSCLSLGCPIGYSSALTLSDQSSKIKRGSKGDISVLKPSIMVAVPMIMDRIRNAVLDKVNGGSRMAHLFFHFAYNYKLNIYRKGYDTPILNRILFSKIRSILGGRVRMIMSGGAPLSAETEEFMNICFCCPVGQGYGLTETCGASTISEAWDRSKARVGHPVSCSEIKLLSWEEGGYTVNDKPYPRGEVAISGNNVGAGYYKQPEKTTEAFVVEDGKTWFYTGDIAEVHDDGVLKIVDRKKDLIKLCHGEYVSLGKVEGIMKLSRFVDNCCVYGDSQESYLLMLVIPHQKNLLDFASNLGENGAFEEICKNKKIIEAVQKDLNQVAAAGKLNKTETPRKIKLCTELWTPESELVTAAFKLKRKNIQSFYESDLEMLYRD